MINDFNQITDSHGNNPLISYNISGLAEMELQANEIFETLHAD